LRSHQLLAHLKQVLVTATRNQAIDAVAEKVSAYKCPKRYGSTHLYVYNTCGSSLLINVKACRTCREMSPGHFGRIILPKFSGYQCLHLNPFLKHNLSFKVICCWKAVGQNGPQNGPWIRGRRTGKWQQLYVSCMQV